MIEFIFGCGLDDDMDKKNGQKLRPLTPLQLATKKRTINISKLVHTLG